MIQAELSVTATVLIVIQCPAPSLNPAMVARNLKKSGRQASTLCTNLSVFGGNFVLAKVRLGLISVRCTELRCPVLGSSKGIRSIVKAIRDK